MVASLHLLCCNVQKNVKKKKQTKTKQLVHRSTNRLDAIKYRDVASLTAEHVLHHFCFCPAAPTRPSPRSTWISQLVGRTSRTPLMFFC